MNDNTTDATDSTRRTLLKVLGAAGVTGVGVATTSGSAAAQNSVFKNIPVETTPSSSDLTLTLSELDVQGDDLIASGVAKGTANENRVNEQFSDVNLGSIGEVITVGSSTNGFNAAQEECPILNLDVGAIFLDLLGLQLETSEINIDLTAVAGSGNLLGNLLCAVAGLLD